jgi:hypothetical protein
VCSLGAEGAASGPVNRPSLESPCLPVVRPAGRRGEGVGGHASPISRSELWSRRSSVDAWHHGPGAGSEGG